MHCLRPNDLYNHILKTGCSIKTLAFYLRQNYSQSASADLLQNSGAFARCILRYFPVLPLPNPIGQTLSNQLNINLINQPVLPFFFSEYLACTGLNQSK